MNRILLLLLITTTIYPATVIDQYASIEPTAESKNPIESKLSNIYLKKITNESNRNMFISLERIHILPLEDNIDIAGHIMPQGTFTITDPKGITHDANIPVWQRTFRGSAINIVTLSGSPGIIYYLYTINNNLWAMKAPSKVGELKGVPLLNAATETRAIELVVKDNNVLEVFVLDAQGNRLKTAKPKSVIK